MIVLQAVLNGCVFQQLKNHFKNKAMDDKFVFIEPILIKAGSNLLRLGELRQPPKRDCRVLSEDTYQELKKAYYIVKGIKDISNYFK